MNLTPWHYMAFLGIGIGGYLGGLYLNVHLTPGHRLIGIFAGCAVLAVLYYSYPREPNVLLRLPEKEENKARN